MFVWRDHQAEVYFRGKLKGDNIIHLPDYWKGLVDPDSITSTVDTHWM